MAYDPAAEEKNFADVELEHCFGVELPPQLRRKVKRESTHLTHPSMKSKIILQAASLATLLFMVLHMTSDVIEQAVGHVKYPIPVVVFVVWLYGTLMLSERVSGYIIMLLGGIIGAGMIVVHSPGLVVTNTGGFFAVWILFMVAMLGWFTAILSARALWMVFRTRYRSKRGTRE